MINRLIRLKKSLQFEISPLSALALGSGLGAAVGCGFISPYILILPFLLIWIVPLRSRVALLCGIAVCWSSGAIRSAMEFRRESDFYRHIALVSGELKIEDIRMCRQHNINLPRYLRCKFKKSDGGEIPLLAEFPSGSGSIPFFGDRFQVSGVLFPPEDAGFEFDGGGFGAPLASPYGRSWILKVENFDTLPAEKSFQRFALEIREILLTSLLAQIEGRENRSMTARFFTGASAGASSESKQSFAISGIIHLFAVSGLHVGVVALMVFWLCRGLSCRSSSLITAGAVLLFVFCSGCSAPAVRAGAMIVIWALLRAMLFYTPSWNILAGVWCGFMVIDPASCGELGVQYSFGITAALVLAFERFSEISAADGDVMELMADGRCRANFIKQRRLRNRIITLFLVPVTAFAAGSVISLARQQLFLPGSVAANLFLPFLLPGLFSAAILKLLFSWWFPAADRIGAWLIEIGFRVLEGVADSCRQIFPAVGGTQVSIGEALLFYALFFAALGAATLKRALSAGIGAMVLFCFLLWRGTPDCGRVMIYSAGSDRPPLVAVGAGGNGVVEVCDLPDPWLAAVAAEDLHRRGYRRAEVVFSDGKIANIRGLAGFRRRMEIANLQLPAGGGNRYFKRVLEDNPGSPVSENPGSGSVEIDRKNGVVRWRSRSGATIISEVKENGRQLTVIMADGRSAKTVVPWSDRILLWSPDFCR